MTGRIVPGTALDADELIGRANGLKGDLLDFAYLPRFDRWLGPKILSAADANGVVNETDAVTEVDSFAMGFRFPDGSTLIDKFMMTAPGRRLPRADKRLLEAWRDDGHEDIFEVSQRDRKNDSVVLHSLRDDLEYRVYCNMGFASFPQIVKGCFLVGRIVPLAAADDDEEPTAPSSPAWLVSGNLAVQPKSAARRMAQFAVDRLAKDPRAAFRNPVLLERARQSQSETRDRFIKFFGADEVVIPTPEVEERISAYYRDMRQQILEELPDDQAGKKRRRQAEAVTTDENARFELPENLQTAETIGVIHDETDGISFVADYGLAKDAFETPKLASEKKYAGLLRGYLHSEDVTPVPLRRLASAYPETADEVFRRVLGKKTFTWSEHGEALLRKRKPWWYDQEPLPQVVVMGSRLVELSAS